MSPNFPCRTLRPVPWTMSNSYPHARSRPSSCIMHRTLLHIIVRTFPRPLGAIFHSGVISHSIPEIRIPENTRIYGFDKYTRRLSTGEARQSRAPAPAAAVAGQPRFQQNPPPTHWQGRGINREGEVEDEDADTVVVPAPQQSAPPQGGPGVNKHGIECKGPNTQKLPRGQKGPNYARNLQKKYQRKALTTIRASMASGDYIDPQGAPQAQYVTQDWQTQFPEIQFPTASTSGIQEIPEYTYPAIDLDSVPTPGPSSLQARLSSVPPVPQSYLSRQSTLTPIPEGKGKAKSVDPTAKSTNTDTWPTGLTRSSNGFYYQNEDIDEYLKNTGHDDTDTVSLGEEEDFHYDGSLTSYHHLPLSDMPTKPVVRASPVSHGLFYGLTVDPLEDTTVPSSSAVTTSWTPATKRTPFTYTTSFLHDVFIKDNTDFNRAQALYKVFTEMASELETTSHFYDVMTRIAENLSELGCKTQPSAQHCDRSHCEPCTLEHATPCTLPHAEPCALTHAAPCTLSHADPCTLPHFFITPEPCPLSHAEPCTMLHIDPCTLSHAEPCTLPHNDICSLNHFPVEPVTVAVTIPCPLAHNDICTKEHVTIPTTSSPTDVVPPLVSSLPAPAAPSHLSTTTIDPTKKQLKRKRFKRKKIVDKLTRAHENDVLCRTQNNSDYEMDSDGFCRNPLNKRELANIKKEFYDEDDENFVNTIRDFMTLADDSDFLADKKPSRYGTGFVVVQPTNTPKTQIPAPHHSSQPPQPPPPHIHTTHSAPQETHPLPPATTSVLPLGTLVPPRSRTLTPSLTPKVSLPRAQTEPIVTHQDITALPQRAQTAPPGISKNTLTARRCTNKDATPSSFVKFMDVPVTMTREHINDCLQNNRKWSSVDISNVEIFAIKNKDSTVVNVLKIKFKDDAQSTTAKRVLTTSIAFGDTISRRCRPWYLSTRSN
ncbi:hypothetical protein JOM56_014562 [Amanita muscaria]